MGQIPAKGFLPPTPYGSSQAANTLNQSQAATQNPQTPLLPPNFTDPGTMQQPTTQALTGPSNPFQGNRPQGFGGSMFGGRGLFGAILFLLLALPSWATTTVTGSIKNLGTGAVTPGSFVRFWLRGCAGNQPRINGTAVIAPTQGGVFFFDLAADASGNISGTIYSTRDNAGTGNGDIECGGSRVAVWYGMQIFNAGKGGPETPIHAKSGATLDVTQVTPITTNPVITPPTGDSTYLRLDAGNSPVTANLSILGTESDAGGTHSGPEVFTSTINCTIVNTIRCISPANPQLWAGSDFGAWVNSASSGYCGTIQVAAGAYSFATQINKPRCINLTGQYGGTVLTWTGTGSTAMIVVHDALGTASYLKGGVSNFFMQGPGAGGSTIALYCGGDPAGVLAPIGDFCDMQDNYNNTITNFGVGLKFGNNAFFINTYSVIDYANGKGIIYPSGLTNSGEALVFVGGAVGNNTGSGLQNDGGGLFKFWSTSFDFNTPQWNGAGLNAECRGCHFENNIGTQIDGTSGLTITIDGGQMFGDQASGTDTQWIIVSSAAANGLVFQNVNISSNHNVTQLINWTGTTPNPVLRISGLSGNGSGKVLALTNALTPFVGEYIDVNIVGINSVHIDGSVLNQSRGFSSPLIDSNNCSGATPTVPAIGSAICANFSSGRGEVDIISNKGVGTAAGLDVYDYNAGTPTLIATINATAPTLNGFPFARALSATTGTITPGALLIDTCSTVANTTVAGATTAMTAVASPTGTDIGDGAYWKTWVSAANTVSIKVCVTVAMTPTPATYAIRVFP